MSIDLRWHPIESVNSLYYHFKLGWSWEDFFAVKRKADTMLKNLDEVVPLIFDLRDAPDMPPNMLTQAYRIAISRHPNGSPVIFLGANWMVENTLQVVRRMLGKLSERYTGDLLFFQTLEEAEAYLVQQAELKKH